jgi:hypothetical protein
VILSTQEDAAAAMHRVLTQTGQVQHRTGRANAYNSDVRRSSSRRGHPAAAKNALALRRMSFARFSSRFSRSSAASRSASLLVGPDRAPASSSAFKSHRRNVSFVQPNFGTMADMAAHWDGWCGNCSQTNRTARSRASGLNRRARDFAMAPSSHKVEPPGIPGRFTPARVTN